MTSTDLAQILERLEALGPQRKLTGKRAQLSEVRARLISLHARGHSWRSIARELSAAGEKVTADLLRSVCSAKVKRRALKPLRSEGATSQSIAVRETVKPAPSVGGSQASDERFGAKGLQP
jgi:hypothetical protein